MVIVGTAPVTRKPGCLPGKLGQYKNGRNNANMMPPEGMATRSPSLEDVLANETQLTAEGDYNNGSLSFEVVLDPGDNREYRNGPRRDSNNKMIKDMPQFMKMAPLNFM